MRRIVLLLVLLVLSQGFAGAQTRTLNVGGGASINYEVTGRGPTVVFIHGWSQNMSVWDDQVPAFKTLYRVLIYDSLGFVISSTFATQRSVTYILTCTLVLLND